MKAAVTPAQGADTNTGHPSFLCHACLHCAYVVTRQSSKLLKNFAHFVRDFARAVRALRRVRCLGIACVVQERLGDDFRESSPVFIAMQVGLLIHDHASVCVRWEEF